MDPSHLVELGNRGYEFKALISYLAMPRWMNADHSSSFALSENLLEFNVRYSKVLQLPQFWCSDVSLHSGVTHYSKAL
jgi:hypothetical protein